jgi:hypothetical protein
MADEPDDELLDDEVEEPEDLDEEDLEDLDEDVLVDDEDDALVDDDEEDDDAVEVPVGTAKETAEGEDDDDEDDDDLEPDDVEASLDEILKERLVVVEDEDEDDEEAPDTDDRAEATTKVLPKQPDEFVCQSCFLVKHPSQLADPKRQYCRDCV